MYQAVSYRAVVIKVRHAGRIWSIETLSDPCDDWILLAVPFQKHCFCLGSGKEEQEASEGEECYRGKGSPDYGSNQDLSS